MKVLVLCSIFLFIYGCVVAPPVTEKKKSDKEHAENNEIDQPVFDVEYKRYLQEIVNVLESDSDFRERLIKADPEDIKSGKISNQLEFVNHNIRSKLDELKRQEMERLRQAAIRHYEESNGIDKKHMKIPAHLDHNNPHTFESEDLRKLIVQTTRELEEVDRKRKDEFKEYEMNKELKYEEQLKHMDEKNRAEAEKFHQKQQEKHRDHKPVHHPGSKQQLEQVWEEQDHLSPEDFSPKTFFHLHDLDGNGVWDANEVKALFKKELDKIYDPNAPEDDIRERFEEMERMREHVFNETDTNRDQLISFQEFMDQTKRQEFERDEGWDPIDQQQHPVYTDDEYKRYAKDHEEEIRRLIEQGVIPPAPPGYVPMMVPPGHHPQGSQFQGHHPQGGQMQHHPNQMQQHPNQIQQHPNQMQQHTNQIQHHPNQMQQHPNQMQQHPNQMQQHPNQMQQHPNQMQQHPNQMQPHQQGQQMHGQQHVPQGQFQPPPGQHAQIGQQHGQIANHPTAGQHQISPEHGNYIQQGNQHPQAGQQQLHYQQPPQHHESYQQPGQYHPEAAAGSQHHPSSQQQHPNMQYQQQHPNMQQQHPQQPIPPPAPQQHQPPHSQNSNAQVNQQQQHEQVISQGNHHPEQNAIPQSSH